MGLYQYVRSNPIEFTDFTGQWTEHECVDFFQTHGATGQIAGAVKGYFNFWHTFTPLEATIYGTHRESVRQKASDANSAYRDLRAALEALPGNHPDRQELNDALSAVGEVRVGAHSDFRFFQFMVKHGCACCPLRDYVRRPAQRKNWHSQRDEIGTLATGARTALGRILGQIGQGGNPMARIDLTNALAAYSGTRDIVAGLGVDLALNHAKILGAAGEHPSCPEIDPVATNWLEAVESSGAPADHD